MDSKYFSIILVIALIAVSGCTQQDANTAVDVAGDDSTIEDEGDAMMEVGTFTITRTDAGYEPSQITIKKGSTVTFVNNSSEAAWPA